MTFTPLTRLLPVAALVALAACQSREEAATGPADLVLANGYVYSADAQRRVHTAVAVRDGQIVALGQDALAGSLVGEQTRVIDLAGRMVLPGLHDAHVHSLGIVQPDICDLQSQAMDLEQLVAFLQDCLQRYPVADGQWLAVPQWNFTAGNQPSERYPTLRSALDAVSARHPIILYGNDGHHGAVNSQALARATGPDGQATGLDGASLEGVFADYAALVATDASGEPSGGVNEGARELMHPPSVFDVMLGAGDHVPREFMLKVARKLAQNGITSIQDAALRPHSLPAFVDLEASGQMSFRLSAALFERPADSRSEAGLAQIPHLVEKFTRVRETVAGQSLISAGAVKIFVDGVIEGDPLASPPTLPNAAVLRDYRQPRFRVDVENERIDLMGYVDTDSELCRSVRQDPSRYRSREAARAFHEGQGFYPDQCSLSKGMLEHSEAFVHEFVRQMTEAGFSIHAHAIGDRAVRVALDAFERNKAAADQAGLTQSLAHVQLVNPEDRRRMGDLGVYVALTWAWVLPDPPYDMTVIPFVEQVTDPERMYDPSTYYMENVYPSERARRAGAVLVAGSDAPVDSREPRPFVNLQQAVTRAADGETLNGQERLDIHEAIAAYTINGARMLGQAERLGSIEVGKLADLVVLDQNLVELVGQGEADRIAQTRVLATIFNGRVVYQDPAL